MKVVVIEDEKPAARRIQALLESTGSIEIVAVLESVKRAKEWFNCSIDAVDLIFSDIQLGDGLSFDIFQDLNIKTPIVFTTAYNEYAIDAFKHNSIAYILKPFVQEDINAALDKFQDFPKSNSIDFNKIMNQLNGGGSKNYRTRFLVNKADQMISIDSSEVAYIYSEDKTTLLKDSSGAKYFIKGSLDDIITDLDPKDFFRIGRGMIVNHKSIDKISNYFSGTLKLELNPKHELDVSVSRRRVADFKEWLNH